MKYSLLKLTAIASLFFLSACDNNDDVEEMQNQADVMVVHASPDAPGVDLYVDNNKVNAAALTYPNNTGYLKVNAGTRNIKVTAAGSTTGVLEAPVPFTAGTNTSIFAFNRLATPGVLVVNDNLAAPASGQAHVRFFHLSPGAPAVTVGTLANTTFTAIPAFTNRAFETQATATANQNFTPLPAGTYTLDVRVASNNTSVLQVPNVTLQAGKIYTIFARGIVGATGAQALGAQVILHN